MKENYESPSIEVVRVIVEKGFATSDTKGQLQDVVHGGRGF